MTIVDRTPRYSRRRPGRSQNAARRRALRTYRPHRLRLVLVWGILMLAMMGLAGRMAYLQLHRGPVLNQLAQQQRYAPVVPRRARYPIIDRQQNVLATDQLVYTLYVHPLLFKISAAEMADRLAPLVEIPVADLRSRFAQQETGIKLATQLPEAVAEKIRALYQDGLELEVHQQRFYPQQDLFASVVGFINLEGEPQGGLELAFEDQLTLSPQAQLASAGQKPVVPTDLTARLQLTLDARLQRVAQQELAATVQAWGAKRGTVMVMDASQGELLALAVAPTYDPNRYYEADLKDLRNWAVSDTYEPGSTFKPINVAIALEEDVIQPQDYVNDSGRMRFGPWTISNHDYTSVGGRGSISITDVLKYSSNVGMVQIMNRLTPATYYDWLEKLEMGSPMGTDLPVEGVGQTKDREQFLNSKVEVATTAFGQGFALTPLKMLQLQGALANGGRLVVPHVVRGLVNDSDEVTWQPQRTQPKAIFSAQTTHDVLAMMEEVVATGTGDSAQVEGYRIGGKTGTAQKVSGGSTYGSGRITSFVGILPVDSPRYVVLAIIDEPKGEDAYGSTVAAPLVQKVTESLVVLEGLPPSPDPA